MELYRRTVGVGTWRYGDLEAWRSAVSSADVEAWSSRYALQMCRHRSIKVQHSGAVEARCDRCGVKVWKY